jgi:radical SAM protein with 4Fe4S-binding SPASM domain
MGCRFCYSSRVRKDGATLPLDVLKSFMDRNNRYIESINYGTGENTLLPVWKDLLLYIQRTYSIPQALTTNGSLAAMVEDNPDRETILSSLAEVDISLDYADPQKHCEMRRHKKAYQWALETIKLCRERGIQTTIVVLGIDETLEIDNLRGLFDLAQHYGTFVRINIYRPNHRQRIKPLSYRALQGAVSFILENHSVVSLGDRLLSALITGNAVPDMTGRTSLRILPNGSITPSTYLVSPDWWVADIRDALLGDGSLARLFQSSLAEESPSHEACASCTVRDICHGGVLDRRIIWYGSPRERDPYCASRYQETAREWKPAREIEYVEGPKIHDGYLPTLIFSPGRRQA